MARVIIVTDLRLYREGIEFALRTDRRLDVLGSAACLASATSCVQVSKPDVVLVDMAMHDSLQVVKEVNRIAPGTKVIALTVREVESEVVACAEAGIAGFVTRDASLQDLVDAVRAVESGELRCSPKVAACLLRRITALASGGTMSADAEGPAGRLDALTRRERSILRLIDEGRSNKEIARTLTIETSTVKNHVHNILEKLNVRRRGEAAALMRLASRHGLPFEVNPDGRHDAGRL